MEWYAAVASEGPDEAGLPRMACDLAAQARSQNQAFKHNRTCDLACSAREGTVEESEDRYSCRCVDQLREAAVQREEHCNGEEPGRDEADGDGAADRDWNVALGFRDFFCQMRGTVEAAEGPVRVDEADNESYARAIPACVIDESCEDKGCWLVGWSY